MGNSKGNPWLENANSLSSISTINQRAQFYNRHSVLLHSCSGSLYSRITWHWAKTQIICCESTINPNSSSAKPESKPPTLSPKTIASADYQLLRLSLSSFFPLTLSFPLHPFSHIWGVGVKSEFRAIPFSQAIYTSSNPLPHVPTGWLHHHHHHHLPPVRSQL